MNVSNRPSVQIGCASNIYIRMMTFHKAGDVEHGHSHNFNHISFLSKGRVKINVDGVEKTFQSPHMIMISKEKKHEITALEDDTILCCIHALRNSDDTEILDPDQIPYDQDPRVTPHKPIS